MISFEDFAKLLNGVYVRVAADNVPTPQCFDIAQLWSMAIGGQRFSGATANLIYNQTQDGFYEQIPNEPTNYPQKGDIVVFNWPHVVVATGNNTNDMEFEALSQNDPDGSDTQIKIFNYAGCIGWLRPKALIN